MTEGILNFPKPSALVPHEDIKSEIALIAAAATDKGNPTKVIEELLTVIVAKCSLCSSDYKGETEFKDVIYCRRVECPLHNVGPIAFQSFYARAKMNQESEGTA